MPRISVKIIWKRRKASGKSNRERFMAVVKGVGSRPWFLAVAILVALGMGWWLGVRAGALWFLFVLFLLYEWENRIIGALAIGSLAACPLLLWLKKDDLAELMAIYAFFFLTMTVALQIVEYIRHPERFLVEEKKKKTWKKKKSIPSSSP